MSLGNEESKIVEEQSISAFHKRHSNLLSVFYNIANDSQFPIKCQFFKENINEQQKFTSLTLLHYACQLGDEEEVKELLEAGADIFVKDNDGNFPMHYLAASTDNLNIFELIYQKAPNISDKKKLISATNASGYPPLWYAIKNKHFSIAHRLVTLYIEFEIDFENFFDKRYKTEPFFREKYFKKRFMDNPFEKRIMYSSVQDQLKNLFLKMDSKSNTEFEDLLCAVKSDDTALFVKLFEKSHKNISKKEVEDLFISAICHDNVENVKLLLPYSCIVSRNQNIFSTAIDYNSIKVTKYLLFNADIKLNPENFENESEFKDGTVMDLCKTEILFQRTLCGIQTLLHEVATTNNVEMFKIISKFFGDVNVRDTSSNTPLHIAAAHKNVEMCCAILEHSDFSLFLTNGNNFTPFYFICELNLIEVLKFITEQHTLLSSPDRRKYILDVAFKTRNVWLIDYVYNDVHRETWQNKQYTIKNCTYRHRFRDYIRNLPKDEMRFIKERIYQEDQAFLKFAIINGFTEATLIFLNHPKWDKFFRHQPKSHLNPNEKSPLQLLIEFMPEAVKVLFDKCIVKFNDKNFIHYGIINDVYYSECDISFGEYVKCYTKYVQNNTTKGDSKGLKMFYSKDEDKVVLMSCDNAENKEKNDKHSEFIPFVADEKEELLPFANKVSTQPLSIMIKHQRSSLLTHPLIDSYVDLKWNKFAKWGYYGLCLYYLFVAIVLTVLAITAEPNIVSNATANANANIVKNTDVSLANGSLINLSILLKLNTKVKILTPNTKLDNTTKVGEKQPNGLQNVVSGGVVSCIFILQIALMITSYKLYHYFDWKSRWFDVLTLIFTIPASWPSCFITSPKTQWEFIVFLNFCASITLLNYIKRHPRFGVYVVMITYVFTSFLGFAPIFFMILLPFVVVFYVLLGEGIGVFPFFDAFIHALVMMIGEFDYKDSVSSKESFITSAMFCLFLFAVTIFLMNLLTGLAVSDTSKILEEAVVTRKIMQIETIHHVQMIMPESIRKKYWNGFCRYPKDVSEIEKNSHLLTSQKFRASLKWLGMPKEEARRIKTMDPDEKLEELNREVNKLRNDLTKKMNEIMEMLKHHKGTDDFSGKRQTQNFQKDI